jgi:hypothetical protein
VQEGDVDGRLWRWRFTATHRFTAIVPASFRWVGELLARGARHPSAGSMTIGEVLAQRVTPSH